MCAARLSDSALPGPRTNPPADGGRVDAGIALTPPQYRPSVIEHVRSTRIRVAALRQRAEGARQRALTLMQEATALMLDAEQIGRPMPPKELLGRSDYARLWARAESMPAIEQAKGILMAQSGCSPEAAFDLLRRASRGSNVPVWKMAAEIVARTAAESRVGSQPGRFAS
jgi:hypothetical protein